MFQFRKGSSSSSFIHMFQLIETLKDAGWTMPNAGDGLAATGPDAVTNPGTAVVGGLGNNNAWVRMRAPDGKELCFQSSGNNVSWRIKYSYSAGFILGAPNSTTMPDAADEQWVWGSAYTSFFGTGSKRCITCADNASPYSFYLWAKPVGAGSASSNHTSLLMDGLIGADALDPDPVVFYRTYNNVSMYRMNQTGFRALCNINTSGSFCHIGATWASIAAQSIGITNGYIMGLNNAGSVTSSLKDVLIRILWARQTEHVAPNGFKGYSSMIRAGWVPRSVGTIIDVGGGEFWFQAGLGLYLPWDGSTFEI